MSALPPKADIGTQPRNVCFVPIADGTKSLPDQFVSAPEKRLWDREVKDLGGRAVDHQLVFCWRLHGQVGRLFAPEDAINVHSRSSSSSPANDADGENLGRMSAFGTKRTSRRAVKCGR